jgi:hypothetical protein
VAWTRKTDVLLSDIDNSTLHPGISKLVGIPYLEEATKDEADKVPEEINGFLYRPKSRMILPRVLSIEGLIVDPRAPVTYISDKVSVHPHRKNALATNLTLGGTSLRS